MIMEKINIAELLEECPQGMELYSPIFGKVYLAKIRPHLGIVVTTDKEQGDLKEEFLYDGRYGMNGECMLFPSKGKTTWEGFIPPCKFKDGDVVYCKDESRRNQLFIIKEYCGNDRALCYLFLDTDGTLDTDECVYNIDGLATEEEKQRLFEAIKAYGYSWNAETKILEKLVEPKFKAGDIIQDKDSYKVKITEVNIEDECYGYESMITKGIGSITFGYQDEWELVPNKLDITTLKPFDKALATFGAEHQRIMCMEECAELIDALAKYDRGRAGAMDVITELADVSIMVEQMAILFGKEEYRKEKERKLKRLQERIKEKS